ncbi:hypothetical protein [Marinobacter salicampi]|uniref:hypothetical protein n=1 Tax=Marinobacter salicampi TaxID=435907 RepID=UPI001407EE39|nr:hypothetical protein [Marinobacter salicampi]
MNITRGWKLVRGGELYYVLGRFQLVRSIYSRLRAFHQSRRRTPSDLTEEATLFVGLDIDAAVQAIRSEAVFIGANLPNSVVDEIVRFCKEEALFARHEPEGGTFRAREVVGGFRPDGRPAPIGAIKDPLSCPAVRSVTEDPGLRSIARKYLGYEPTKIMTLLYWSFASSFTDEERRRMLQHVIDYHYDVGGYNFVYASFYLLDTVRSSGAHIMVRGSHKEKPLRMLWGSAVASEDQVYLQFGKENELVIEGPAGTGFVEDTSCYHRASPPTSGDRLLLQIRFS